MNLSKSSPEPKRDFSRLGPAGLRAFFNIATRWELTESEQMRILGISNSSMLLKWKAGEFENISDDTLERISLVLGIFKSIGILLPIPERADAWMRAPNSAPIFNGGSALDRMTSGDVSDLYLVRQYLDAERF